MPSSTTANEALGRLDPERRRWIEEFRDGVRALLGERLRDIRLFGSEARGEGGEGSDIDILVLVDGFDLDTWKSVHNMAYSISPVALAADRGLRAVPRATIASDGSLQGDAGGVNPPVTPGEIDVMDIRIQCVVIDAGDCERLARFWSQALGWRITYQSPNEFAIEPPEGSPAVDVAPDILFVKVPERKTVKNRLHLDLRPRDQQAQVDRLIELGASRVNIGQADDVSWVVMADPEGNESCVMAPRSAPEE